MSDDITFCGSDCDNKKCFRHPSNIAEPGIPHSFSYFKGTETCPYSAKKTVTPEQAVERVISLLQSCKGSDGCLGYIERYFDEEDEQAIDIAIQLLNEGEIYMNGKDYNLYLEGYKQGKKDFERPQGEWVSVSEKLPERYKEVIVTDIETSGTYQSRYVGNGYWECDNGTLKNRIIAWQPLPEPYKKGGAE